MASSFSALAWVDRSGRHSRARIGATRPDAKLGLWPDDRVTIDTEHPDEITVCRHQFADRCWKV